MGLLDEQRAYYQARANEYDEWWYRQGRYALPPDEERGWFADVAAAEQALDDFAPIGDVLELACGTGLWTRRLAPHATTVLAVDASPAVLTLNRARDLGPHVRYEQADLFRWEPPRSAFDVVFFSYWLSHVPAGHFAAFWAKVAAALRPRGRVFLIDSHHHTELPGHIQQRTLNDGREFRVVKHFWQPADLQAAVAPLGWHLTARTTPNDHILHATATATPR
ncbi:class I SAM-dependent methyltransferase [Actinoplanes sp. TRM 88003]|uniref:Class I SAM-dependent methyltransferase n=1 Tax=Paractinoplanes aksuensis TaxID=2939490 RepID=A0ABT1DYV4_9ACTN|nr:class I SAM-dependent methyltransferase [Actinoplanes aksuensis]MCO8276008.1 class I SAM-dependent methyltransferase [Actinoplanes aksuensis]